MKSTLFKTFLPCLFFNAVHAENLNPLLTPSKLPFQAPAFNKIKDQDYSIAFKNAIYQQLLEINEILNNHEGPNFKNTIEALQKSGQTLDRVSLIFTAVVQANTNDILDQTQSQVAPLLAAHQDAIFLNPKLYERVKAVYEKKDRLKLTPEENQVVKISYDQFIHAGAELNNEDRIKLREINKELASLETLFKQKLIAAVKKNVLTLKDKKSLDGLSEDQIISLAHHKKGDEEYIIPLQNTTQQPLLQSLVNRNVREKLFNLSWHRNELNDENDTRSIIQKIALLRATKAKLLGYPNYAAYVLYDQMVETPKNVHEFLDKLVAPTAINITHDEQKLQKIMTQEYSASLKPWDWDYYSEIRRKIEYNLEESEVRPYFELNTVLKKGLFYAASLLYGINLIERYDIPVYHPDVRVFTVVDKNKKALGLIYFDFYQRDNKAGGAWMGNFVQQSRLLKSKPVVYNVTNFTKPAFGIPTLLTFDEVRTLFHEFGHALHGLFANTMYAMSNNNIARDFIEFPSQFNEHWALYPKVLKHYALHYRTEEPISDSLIEKIKKTESFNQAYALGEILAAAELDLKWHELLSSDHDLDVDSFEQTSLQKTNTNFSNVPPRYRSSYFLHIWANGYAAGYYAYLWTEMLDDNAFKWFMDHGGLTRTNGQRFRDIILSKGHLQDYNSMFFAFNGRKPEITPLLDHRGLTSYKSI